MTDAARRTLERAASAGDPDARAALAAQRVRAQLCPWCGEADELEELDGCCCFSCYLEAQRAGRLTRDFACQGCPARCSERVKRTTPADAR